MYGLSGQVNTIIGLMIAGMQKDSLGGMFANKVTGGFMGNAGTANSGLFKGLSNLGPAGFTGTQNLQWVLVVLL